MNWKNRPELFIKNFKARYRGFYASDTMTEPYTIVGVDEYNGFKLKDFSHKNLKGEWVPSGHCKLVARSVDDMTDEEIKNHWNIGNWQGPHHVEVVRNSIKEQITKFGYVDDTMLFLYLLSLGVYPFSDDTDVNYETTKTNKDESN